MLRTNNAKVRSQILGTVLHRPVATRLAVDKAMNMPVKTEPVPNKPWDKTIIGPVEITNAKSAHRAFAPTIIPHPHAARDGIGNEAEPQYVRLAA